MGFHQRCAAQAITLVSNLNMACACNRSVWRPRSRQGRWRLPWALWRAAATDGPLWHAGEPHGGTDGGPHDEHGDELPNGRWQAALHGHQWHGGIWRLWRPRVWRRVRPRLWGHAARAARPDGAVFRPSRAARAAAAAFRGRRSGGTCAQSHLHDVRHFPTPHCYNHMCSRSPFLLLGPPGMPRQAACCVML